MKPFITLVLVCAGYYAALAQKEANIWYFGQYAGLDFNTNCQPTALDNSQMNADYGSAVMSDGATGQLLFYSNSYQVWNRDHQLMPNGKLTEYIGAGVETQTALIVPVPGTSSLYYLFRLDERNATHTGSANYGRLTYSTIDMRLDGGRGDVVSLGKDSTLVEGLAGRLTAVRHTNGRDYWVLTHQYNSNAFLVYPVTTAGVGPADTLRIGSEYRDQAAYGYLKASPDGHKLASSSLSNGGRPFDLFDFDAQTGKLSNYVNLGNIRLQSGVSFSPDNTKLYVANRNRVDANNESEIIRQYDLNAGSTQAIIASGQSVVYKNPNTNILEGEKVAQGFLAFSLEIGPDGRIYSAAEYSNSQPGAPCTNCARHLMVINKPNALGFACNPQLQAAELGTGQVGNVSDMPNFMQHYFNGLEPKDCAFDRNDECTDANVQLFPNPTKDVMELLITDVCFTPYTLRLINVAGQVLATHEITTPRSQKLDVRALPAGVYFAELRFQDRTTVKRFIRN